MLIRHHQMEVWEDLAAQRFQTEMAGHARWFAPELTSTAGLILEPVIRLTLDRCAEWGFTDRGPARLFLEMVLSYGWGFDTDPLLPWAASSLNAALDQHSRANRLYSCSRDYVHAVFGENDNLTAAALRRAAALTDSSLGNSSRNLDDRISDLFRLTYPSKYHYSGIPAIAKLLNRAQQTAAQFHVTEDSGRAAIAGALFAFGHQAISDPYYPWIASALAGELPQSERVAALQYRLRAYFRRAADTLEGPGE